MTLRLFVLSPTVLFRARINQVAFVYPLAQVAYDGVTVGSYGLVERDLTIVFGTTEGGDDLGRQRTRSEPSASVLKFGRSSEGVGDGEVALQNDAYITVLDDRRVWAKIPYATDTVPVVQYKDHDIPVGLYTTNNPPVANAGSPAAGTIDAISGVLRVRLPAGANNSYTVATGATITTYVWTLPAGVTLVAGYALSDAVIEVDCEPGFYWVGLAVTDSNGQTHEAWTWILARDPDADVTVTGFVVRSHRRSQAGQTLEVELTQPLPLASYPDGTLVALIDGDPTAANDRTNILFWGWHQLDPAEIRAERTGLLKRTRLTCVDVAGRLASLPGFPQMVENDAVRDVTEHPSITWSHMVDFDLEKYIDYLLRWHSTALEVTDYLPSQTAGIYAIGGALQSDGASLWEQVVGRVRAFTPAKNIGCNKIGQLVIRHNPMVENPADRTTTVQAALTAANWSDLRWTHQRPPRVHWLRGSAVQAIATLPTGADGAYQPVFFCIAPGFAPGQGVSADTRGNLLADSQTRLNDAMGHEYARLNARESLFDVTLVSDQYLDLDPASMEWVTLTVDAAYAAQRGLSFTAARGLAAEIEYGYRAQRGGLVRTATMRWERETVGRPALTIVQPDVPQTGDPYVPPAPPENTAPVITLIGDNPLVFLQGQTYVDPGATAADAEDGDITANIVVAGDVVNTNLPGSYIVTYNVMDSALLAATEVTRTVTVTEVSPLRVAQIFTPADVTMVGSVMTITLDSPIALYDRLLLAYIGSTSMSSAWMKSAAAGNPASLTRLFLGAGTYGHAAYVSYRMQGTTGVGATVLEFDAASFSDFIIVHLKDSGNWADTGLKGDDTATIPPKYSSLDPEWPEEACRREDILPVISLDLLQYVGDPTSHDGWFGVYIATGRDADSTPCFSAGMSPIIGVTYKQLRAGSEAGWAWGIGLFGDSGFIIGASHGEMTATPLGTDAPYDAHVTGYLQLYGMGNT